MLAGAWDERRVSARARAHLVVVLVLAGARVLRENTAALAFAKATRIHHRPLVCTLARVLVLARIRNLKTPSERLSDATLKMKIYENI